MGLTRTLRLLAVLALVTVSAAPAFPQIVNSIDIHGFGGWAYGKTDGFDYAIGNSDGKYDNAEFALNVSAKANERLSVVAQVFLQSSSDMTDAQLDYAFAEWAFNDAAKLRIGRVKHPFGIYGEIFDVGTLRPFYMLPQGLYGPNGFTAKAYNGIGFTGRVPFRHGWSMQYDVYGGQIEGDFKTPGLLSSIPEYFAEPSIKFSYHVNDAFGARVNINTPVDGLMFGVSGFTGKDHPELEVLSAVRRDVYAGHVEYAANRFQARGEWGHLKNGNEFNVEAKYVEVAYKLDSHWQLASRWDEMQVDLPGFNFSTVPGIFPQLLDHRDLSIGLNYWFRPDFVVRASYHDVDGNRYSFPATTEEVLQALATDTLAKKSNLVVIGAQFSF